MGAFVRVQIPALSSNDVHVTDLIRTFSINQKVADSCVFEETGTTTRIHFQDKYILEFTADAPVNLYVPIEDNLYVCAKSVVCMLGNFTECNAF